MTNEEKGTFLEEEIGRVLRNDWYGEYVDFEKFAESAKYFFKLGFEAAQKKSNTIEHRSKQNRLHATKKSFNCQ